MVCTYPGGGRSLQVGTFTANGTLYNITASDTTTILLVILLAVQQQKQQLQLDNQICG